MEWLENIWQWILNNYQAIVAFLSSANIVGIASNVIFLLKQSKTTTENTSKVSGLTTALTKLDEIKDTLENTNSMNKSLVNELKAVESENLVLKESLTSTNKKLDGLIDALSIVYSTIKDDSVRQTVGNILNATKYDDFSGVTDKITETIDNKLADAIEKATVKITEEVSSKLIADKSAETTKTMKKSKVSTTRY